jgi:4-amino-4-deoxy-L-arabinose transferase-like glycosyltransferase
VTQPAEIRDARSGRLGAVAWAAAFLLLAVAGMATLWWPMGRDQGIYAFVGSIVARGGAPYSDAWEVKGPATHLIYAASQLLFGTGMWGIRLLDLLFVGTAAALAWRALRRLGCGRASLVAPWVFVALYWQLGFWDSAQPDSWVAVVLLAALSLTAFDTDASRPSSPVILGVLLGLCALLKPLFGCLIVLPFAYAWNGRGSGLRSVLRYGGLAVAGFAAVIGVVFGWLAIHGALSELFEIQLEFNRVVHSQDRSVPLLEHFRQLVIFFGQPMRLFLAPLAWIGAVAAWRERPRLVRVCVVALFLCVACVAVQGKYYPYHLVPIHAPLVLLAALGIDRLAGLLAGGERFKRQIVPAFLVTIVAVNLLFVLPGAGSWLRYLGGSVPKREFYSQFGAGLTDFSFQECKAVAERLESETAEGDTVVVWAIDPLIHFLSQRMPPSRFGGHFMLTRGARNPLEAKYRAEYMADLEERSPAMIVVADRDTNNLLDKPSIRSIDDFPAFREYLNRHYRPDVQVGRFYLWRRTGAGQGRTPTP